MIPHTFQGNWIIDASVSVEGVKTWTVDFEMAQNINTVNIANIHVLSLSYTTFLLNSAALRPTI
jgi:hypothetical protein